MSVMVWYMLRKEGCLKESDKKFAKRGNGRGTNGRGQN